MDRQTLDTLQKVQRLVHDSIGSQRKDFEKMVVRLGTNIQEALADLQNQTNDEIRFYATTQEQNGLTLKNDLKKENHIQLELQIKAIHQIKEDLRKEQGLNQEVIQLAIEKEVSA